MKINLINITLELKMGSTCGGVANACCASDLNVDIRNQVEGDKNDGKLQGSNKKNNKSSF